MENKLHWQALISSHIYPTVTPLVISAYLWAPVTLMHSWDTTMLWKCRAIKYSASRLRDGEVDRHHGTGLLFPRVSCWCAAPCLLAMRVASTEPDAIVNSVSSKATGTFSAHRTPFPLQVFLGTFKHPPLLGTLLTSGHGIARKCYFPMGNKGENYSFRPSRSICCCWTQTLWSPCRPFSSADFRSSGGQRSSPLSTSPDSVGSTTIDGSLLDSLGYFSRASGKAWGDIWGHACQSLAHVQSKRGTCSILASFLHLTCTTICIKNPLQSGADWPVWSKVHRENRDFGKKMHHVAKLFWGVCRTRRSLL